MSDPATPHPFTAWASTYARGGWPCFPLHTPAGAGCSCSRDCGNPGKHPRTRRGLKEATTDVGQISDWGRQWPDANVGVVTGPASGIVVVDIDPRSGGDATWQKLCDDHDAPLTVRCDTGGGGWHMYFRYPKGRGVIRSRAGALGQGVDVKADGGYVVAPPSLHASGRRYTWSAPPREYDLAEMPDWLLELVCRDPRPARKPAKPTTEDGWLLVAFRSAGWLGDRQASGGYAVRCPWTTEHTSGREFDGSTVVFPPDTSRTMGWLHCSHAHCAGRTLADVRRSLPDAATKAADAAYPPRHTARTDGDGVVDDGDWQADLDRKTGGGITASHHNVISVLAHDPRWSGVLAWNEFSERIDLRKLPPWHPDDAPAVPSSSWQDSDDTRLVAWLGRYWSAKIGIAMAHDAVEVVARCNTWHPVRSHLAALAWDGIKRLPTWLHDVAGACACPYASAIGTRWLIQLVARVMQPGCRADSVLVLEGAQGVRKSSMLALLATDEWYADDIGDISKKDAADALRGKWLIELGELAGVRKSDQETQKAFISRRVDHYRPAYGRATIDRLRQCCFAGTTNAYLYLGDETGARRNWGIKVGRIDLDMFASVRDQLLAEAVARYESGEQWWLLPEEEPEQADEQESRRECHPWEAPIRTWLAAASGEITIERVLTHCIGVEVPRQDLGDSRSVARCLRALGWSVAGQRGARGRRTRIWECMHTS